MQFFENLGRFSDRTALIDAESGRGLTYAELESAVVGRCAHFPQERCLVFMEIENTIDSLIDYIAVLRGGHVVYLLDDAGSDKSKALISAYRPRWVHRLDGQHVEDASAPNSLHPGLMLLLSTSGSTGTPKFVKLSYGNVNSNARSIAQYLGLDAYERAYAHLKPFYSFGISVINSHLAVGASLILSTRSITEPEFLSQVQAHQATSFAGVPYTFESLDHLGFDVRNYPSLRMLTQAGGRLDPSLVVKYAKLCREAGKQFFVMYGQTEAAPRMSYLPPEHAEEFPGSIGVAIPEGRLYIVDQSRQMNSAPGFHGELAYSGPNVMMGYASSSAELAQDDTPPALFTGDLAYMNDKGLFFITGRASRFVKMFGLRINLDQVQSDLKSGGFKALVSGNDQKIVVAVEPAPGVSEARVLDELAKRYGLPRTSFMVFLVDQLPLLPNGKYDYKTLLSWVDLGSRQTKSWWAKVKDVFIDVLELQDRDWSSVSEMYAEILSIPLPAPHQSFESLGGDSLTFVTLSIEMEAVFGKRLPNTWRQMTLEQLEVLFHDVRMMPVG